jgi:hypothetical protein
VKSGYRWSAKKFYKDIKFGDKPGVDVKVPWGLSRMQHLPQLTLLYSSYHDKNSSIKYNKYSQEFRNQILDFISTNPVGYGVNWACPMDVAIRAINWLVSYDIFSFSGVKYDSEFKIIF